VNISPMTPFPGTSIWEQYRDRITVPRSAHELWDLSHVLLPTRMPLPDYYKQLIKLYAKTCIDMRRASRLALRTRPPIWSPRYLRLWLGAVRIYFQFVRAHRHHDPDHLAEAMDLGPAVVPVPKPIGWAPSDVESSGDTPDVPLGRLSVGHRTDAGPMPIEVSGEGAE
jgi:hypothetical protein